MPFKPPVDEPQSPSLLQRITTPIVDQLPAGVKEALENFAHPGLNTSHAGAMLRGFLTGATEAITPAHVASIAAMSPELAGVGTLGSGAALTEGTGSVLGLGTPVATAAARTIPTGIKMLSGAGGAVLGAQGVSDAMDPNKSMAERALGAGNAALGGLVGARGIKAGYNALSAGGKAAKAAAEVAPEISDVSTVEGLHGRLRNIREATLRNDPQFPGGHELTPAEQMYVQDQILKDRQFGAGGKNAGAYEQAMKNHTDLLAMSHKAGEAQFKPIEAAQKRAAAEVDATLKNHEQQMSADDLARRKAELELKAQGFRETTTATNDSGTKTTGTKVYGPPEPEEPPKAPKGPQAPPAQPNPGAGPQTPPPGPTPPPTQAPAPEPEVLGTPPSGQVNPEAVRAAADSIPYTEPFQEDQVVEPGALPPTPEQAQLPPAKAIELGPGDGPEPPAQAAAPDVPQETPQAPTDAPKPQPRGKMPKLSKKSPKGFQQAAENIANQASAPAEPVPTTEPTPIPQAPPEAAATAPDLEGKGVPESPNLDKLSARFSKIVNDSEGAQPAATVAPNPAEPLSASTSPSVPESQVPTQGAIPVMRPKGWPIFKSERGLTGMNVRNIGEAVKAGDAPPEALDVAKAANARIIHEQNTGTGPMAQFQRYLSGLTGDERSGAISNLLSNQSGAMDPEMALRMGLTATGGLIGGATDPVGGVYGESSPTTRTISALGGGILGAAGLPALKMAINAPYSSLLANRASNQSFMDKLNNLHSSGMLSPISVAKKAFGDIAGMASASTENMMSNALLRGTGNAPVQRGSILGALINKAPEIFQTAKEATLAPQSPDLSGAENMITSKMNPLSWSGRLMSGLTAGTKQAMQEAGYTRPEQQLYTMTSQPQTDIGAGAYDLIRRSKVARFFSPFARMGINRLERGYERSPLGLSRLSSAGSPQERAKIISRILLGTGVAGGAYEATPDNFVKEHPLEASLIGAAAGPFGVPVIGAMAMKNKAKSPVSQAAKTVAKDIPGAEALQYLTSSPEEFARTTLSGFTNFASPLAQVTNPGKPVTQGSSLNGAQRIVNRALANLPVVRGMLPQQGAVEGLDGLTNDQIMELLK
jgi:hypothetical protein